MRVLLADDHGIVRRGLKGLLEEEGLPVVAEAADGLEAIRLTEEHRPDLLIIPSRSCSIDLRKATASCRYQPR